jgi:hypothetical protein
MNRFLTRDRVVQSLVDGVFLGVLIFAIDVFLSKRSVETALTFAVAFGVIAFVLRVFTRPFRSTGSVR